MRLLIYGLVACLQVLVLGLQAANPTIPPSPGDWLTKYFERETAGLESACLSDGASLESWVRQRDTRRQELLDMLGLRPLPDRGELMAEVTGALEYPDFVVEKLHFQSLPGLYVTANFYRPLGGVDPLPAILYACGHAAVKTNGVSCGNKTAYQHHGIWYAQHGYACLVLDTVQLGEIEGLHHGTYREGMWWWNSRGYTPAGVEVWNAMRALDYLESREDVDADRIGMTGRSGGGWYTWVTAAVDERVRVAAPVAGMTDLRNQVLDGCVEGHCDCMFFINTYRWDFPRVAALVAPRPLLIVNTDADSIFPLDGVVRLHAKAKRVYEWYGRQERLGLVIGPGPHRDTQDLQVPVFRWMNRHLQEQDPLITRAAEKRIDPMDLRVFDELPGAARNAHIQEGFVPSLSIRNTEDVGRTLRTAVFAGWPTIEEPLVVREDWRLEREGLRLRILSFESQPDVRLPLFSAELLDGEAFEETVIEILDEKGWTRWCEDVGRAFPLGTAMSGAAQEVAWRRGPLSNLVERLRESRSHLLWMAPRGIGPSAWQGSEEQTVHVRRRFMLLGQTLDGMRVWDVRQALRAVREVEPPGSRSWTLAGKRDAAVHVLYAALTGASVTRLKLEGLPPSQAVGPDYLNVLRFLDIEDALKLVRTGGQGLEVEVLDLDGG